VKRSTWLVDNDYVSDERDPKNNRTQLHSYLKPYPSDGPTVIRSTHDDDPFGEG
jgi:hypothetical protein